MPNHPLLDLKSVGVNQPTVKLAWQIQRHYIRTPVPDYEIVRCTTGASVHALMQVSIERAASDMQTYITGEFLSAHADVEERVTKDLPYSGEASMEVFRTEVAPTGVLGKWALFVLGRLGLVETTIVSQTVRIPFRGTVNHTYVRTIRRLLDPFISTRVWPNELRRSLVIEEARLGVAEYAWVPVREG